MSRAERDMLMYSATLIRVCLHFSAFGVVFADRHRLRACEPRLGETYRKERKSSLRKIIARIIRPYHEFIGRVGYYRHHNSTCCVFRRRGCRQHYNSLNDGNAAPCSRAIMSTRVGQCCQIYRLSDVSIELSKQVTSPIYPGVFKRDRS